MEVFHEKSAELTEKKKKNRNCMSNSSNKGRKDASRETAERKKKIQFKLKKPGLKEEEEEEGYTREFRGVDREEEGKEIEVQLQKSSFEKGEEIRDHKNESHE